MLYFGRVGSSWGHRAFFGSSWREKVITPNFFLDIFLLLFWIIVILFKLWILFILCLPFFLLRQKGGVFFVLDRDCIFKLVKWFLSQNGQRWSLLVCDWLYFVWQKLFYVILLHFQGYRLFQSLLFINVLQEIQRRFCADSKSEKSDPKLLFEWPSHASGRPSMSTVQGCIRPDALQSSRRI